MYFGEMFISKSNMISWSFITKPRNHIDVNKPLIVGFVDERYNPPFRPIFEPISAMRGQALKLLSKTQIKTDVYDLFNKWVNLIPNVASGST